MIDNQMNAVFVPLVFISHVDSIILSTVISSAVLAKAKEQTRLTTAVTPVSVRRGGGNRVACGRFQSVIIASQVQFVNLTGHEIRLGGGLVIPKAPSPTRVINGRAHDGKLVLDESDEVIPIYRFDSGGHIVGLPDPQPGVIYIVSPIVRKELTQRGAKRPDVFSPYAIESRFVKGRDVPCATALAR